MKYEEKDIKRWCRALRSGKYNQGTGELEVYKGEYCCLGLGCLLFTPKGKLERFTDDSFLGFKGTLYGETPEDQNHAPKWLKEINGDFEEKTGFNLSDLNDGGVYLGSDASPDYNSLYHGLSFTEIADCIEAVYIHKVLD